MVNVVRAGLALLAVVLFGIGLAAMTAGNLTFAGMSYLGASLVIYFRETR
jgi:hypothetical protein